MCLNLQRRAKDCFLNKPVRHDYFILIMFGIHGIEIGNIFNNPNLEKRKKSQHFMMS